MHLKCLPSSISACHWLCLLALTSCATASFAEENMRPALVGVTTRKPWSRAVGELVRESESDIEIIDLRDDKKRVFNKSELLPVRRDISDQAAIDGAGVANYMAWRIKKMLPVASAAGKVAQIDGSLVYINIGSKVGLEVGNQLNVYRGQTEIKDPDTGEVLGKQRRKVGRIELVDVEEKLSKAKMLGDLEITLQVGDLVEPVVSAKSIAIFPFANEGGGESRDSKQIEDMLTNALVGRGVSTVERRSLVKVLTELGLQQTGLFETEKAQSIGKQLGAYGLILGAVTPTENSVDVQLRLVRVETGEILIAASQQIKNSVEDASEGDAPEKPLSVKPKGAKPSSTASEWLNETYSFTVRKVGPKKWQDFDKNGRIARTYSETARTNDYVELFSPEGKYSIRLFSNKQEIQKEKGGPWGWSANGKWKTPMP